MTMRVLLWKGGLLHTDESFAMQVLNVGSASFGLLQTPSNVKLEKKLIASGVFLSGFQHMTNALILVENIFFFPFLFGPYFVFLAYAERPEQLFCFSCWICLISSNICRFTMPQLLHVNTVLRYHQLKSMKNRMRIQEVWRAGRVVFLEILF